MLASDYRTHTCGELRESHIGETVRVSGWVMSVRDHGGVLFVDLRDHYGVLQLVLKDEDMLRGITKETVIQAEGPIVRRDDDTLNPKLATGFIELRAQSLQILGKCASPLPFDITSSKESREDLRLKYRFLDLRSPKAAKNLVLRARLLTELRKQMEKRGFLEVQTPILTASSPEGARDYLIPSRKHPGKFYALPQAPQIFKQLLMIAGVDRYYQIAPCFRDEDARADRSPGEFYQLDFEMAFAGQEEVLRTAEELLFEIFTSFSDWEVSKAPFQRITYREAMLRYGSDKPDLRNPLVIDEVSDFFTESDFLPFQGQCVRAIRVPGGAGQPRSFFDDMLTFALSIGMKGLGYLKMQEGGVLQGPIDKFLTEEARAGILSRTGLRQGDVLFFIADFPGKAPGLAGQIRTRLGEKLDLLEKNAFRFLFVVDFPMFERDPGTGKFQFTHNPFSMPEGGFAALTQDPLSVTARQYDVVVNGVELSSGAERCHDLKTLLKAFSIAGYSEETVLEKFPALTRALSYGAPPHAGMAPGIDRMLMLLTGEENIREVIAFPMSASAEDPLTGAPAEVSEKQLMEAHIKVRS